MRPTNRRRTLAIAGCVGTLLVAINQSGPLLSGPRTALLWARVALDYVVPFAVSNLGVLAGTHAGKSPVMPAGAEPQSGGSPLARPRRRARVAVLAIVIVMVAVAGGAFLAHPGSTTRASSAPSSREETRTSSDATTGTYTLLDGRAVSLAALRGRPALVWFVAPGCSSCQASIPVMASHLSAFVVAKTRVLVLGIYGALPAGQAGLSQFASFGSATAGPDFSSLAWTWALASLRLTTAYDPAGVPDEYFLLDSAGRVVYTGATVVSTIGVLLGHLDSLVGTRPSGSSSSPTSAPSGTLP